MKRGWRSAALALGLAAAFFAGVIGLFNREFASGELYPEFSSMRADRMGTKLLYDSLGKLPGIEVERNFLPVEFWPRDEVTVLLLGVNPLQVDWDESRFLRQVEEIATRGNRLVVALYEDPDQPRLTQQDLDIQEEESPRARGRHRPGRRPGSRRSGRGGMCG